MSVVYSAANTFQADGFSAPLPKRDVGQAVMRGLRCRCPNCGKGSIFKGYTSVNESCPSCGEVLSHQRADDFPPYITIFITAHIIVGLLFFVEREWHPEMWVHMALWLPLTVILSLGLLRPVKGAIIGLQWAIYMHGFNPRHGEDEAIPDPAGRMRAEG